MMHHDLEGLLVAVGPVVGSYMGYDIPAWIEPEKGTILDFAGVISMDADLDSLGDNFCIIQPGLFYEAKGEDSPQYQPERSIDNTAKSEE
jgi:hypothetical protein